MLSFNFHRGDNNNNVLYNQQTKTMNNLACSIIIRVSVDTFAISIFLYIVFEK